MSRTDPTAADPKLLNNLGLNSSQTSATSSTPCCPELNTVVPFTTVSTRLNEKLACPPASLVHSTHFLAGRVSLVRRLVWSSKKSFCWVIAQLGAGFLGTRELPFCGYQRRQITLLSSTWNKLREGNDTVLNPYPRRAFVMAVPEQPLPQ